MTVKVVFDEVCVLMFPMLYFLCFIAKCFIRYFSFFIECSAVFVDIAH